MTAIDGPAGDTGKTSSGGNAGLRAGSRVVAVPGADAALLKLDLPRGVGGVSREDVARRQLRDLMGIDPDRVEIRPFTVPRNIDQWNQLLVVDVERAAHWRQDPKNREAVILPDYLTLPTAEDVWTVAEGADGIAVRLGPLDGFGADMALAKIMLERALSAEDCAPKACLRLGLPLAELEELFTARGIAIHTDPEALGAHSMAHGEARLDLRQDPQLARARLAARILPWRWPVALGLVAGAMWAVSQVVATDRILEDKRNQKQETMDLVQEHFVGSAPVLDTRVQVSQALAEARAKASGRDARPDPLALFARAARALDRAGAKTDLASYDMAEGLQVTARVEDFAAIERLVNLLEEERLEVSLQETEAVGFEDGVRAVMQLATTEQSLIEAGQ